MNDRRKMEIKVGALVIASISAVFLFVVLLGDFSLGPVERFHADFPHSGGLKVGAPVMMAGVTVGKVDEINLVRQPATGSAPGSIGRPGVRVTVSIPSEQFAAIPSDVSPSIASRSVLGEKHLELTPGPGGVAPLVPGAVLDGRPPAGLEKAGDDAVSMIRQLSTFMDENGEDLSQAIRQVRDLSRDAGDFLRTSRPKLDETVENLRLASARLAAEVGPGGRVSSVLTRADRVMKRIDGATVDVEQDLPKLVRDVGVLANRADRLVSGLDKLVTEMTDPTVAAVRNLRNITETIDSGNGTVGKLVQDETLFDDISAFVKDLKAHPWKLLWKK